MTSSQLQDLDQYLALDPSTDMGPLIDKADVTRGRRPGPGRPGLRQADRARRPRDRGRTGRRSVLRPALLEVEDVSTEIVQKEVFGPVATFEVFDTETDAISRANATEHSLAAGIFTSSINISRRVSREIHASTIWTNTWGGDQRRLRRGRLQAKRHRPPAWPPGHHRVPASQDRRPRHPAAPGLTRPTRRRK